MRRRKKIAWLVILGLFFFVGWFYVIGISSNRPGSFFNTGNNAVWLGHQWVGVEKSEAEIQKLVANLTAHEIGTVFVHSGPLNADGGIEPSTYKYAVDFVEQAKRYNGEIEYQAWLGQIRSKIDLGDEEVRKNVAKQCMIFGELVGFDGIHFDIEPVWDGDGDFIFTLKECRERVGEDVTISVALAELIPQSFLRIAKPFKEYQNYNSEVNYRNVARYADQVVVMTYDLSVDREWWYRWLVAEQTIRTTALLDGTEVFVGIPAYDEATEAFNPEAENVESGVRGVLAGLNNIRSEEENFEGIAIYPYWTIDEEEWAVYDSLWIYD